MPKTIKELADEFGVSKQAIKELADEFGVSKQAIKEKTRCKL